MSRADAEDGRVRRRIEAMRRVQSAALDLFERKGFDAVTVDDVARAARVGPATVYRNFSTKERLVLWDEYDPALLDAIRGALTRQPLLTAVTGALVGTLGRIYDEDRARILRRTKLLFSVPALMAASEIDRETLRAELAKLLTETRAVRDELGADVAAAAIVATLATAVARWARDDAERPLAAVFRDAFRSLGSLATAAAPRT